MNRRVVIGIVSLVILAAVAYFGVMRLRAAGANAGAMQYKVAKVTTGEVRKTVSASGILQPWNVIDVKARAGGEMTLLAVDVGDEVKKGQLIARIDPLDVTLSYNTATAAETSAIARKNQSSVQYKLQVEQSAIAIRDAEASLASSKASLAQARARLATGRTQAKSQPELTRTAIANARAAYDQAVKQLQSTQVTNEQEKAAAKAAYDQAVANQTNARLTLDRQNKLVAQGFVAKQTVDTAAANLAVIDAQVNSAKAKLDTIDAEQRAAVETAQARVNQSKAALDQAQTNSIAIQNSQNSERELTAAVQQAEAQVKRAQVALDQAKANQANNQLRNLDIKAAEASIASAHATKVNAQVTLQRTEITAPFAGVVLQKYVDQGTIIASALSISAQGTSIIQLGDTSRMYVDVKVDETDIASVDIGQKVTMKMDAYPDVPYEGKVIRVDPRAQVEQNVTTIHVRVEVDNSSNFYRLLKPGMNTTCEFVVSQKDNVVKIPNEAIREDDQGKYVETATGGKPAPPDPKTGTPAEEGALVDVKTQRVAVETGIEGNDETEITKGLKDGDTIVTQTIEPTPQQGGGSPFGGFGRGMGGGRGGGGGGGRGR